MLLRRLYELLTAVERQLLDGHGFLSVALAHSRDSSQDRDRLVVRASPQAMFLRVRSPIVIISLQTFSVVESALLYGKGHQLSFIPLATVL